MPPPDPRAAVRRDTGLRRVSRLTRWVLAGALALTGVLSAIAAHAFPGSGTAAGRATPSTAQAGTSAQAGSSAAGADHGTTGGGLQAPASAPSAASGSGAVTSGGS